MSYQKIGLGNTPEDGLGDGLRTGGAKVNSNFEELYSRNFRIGDAMVSRLEIDSAVLSLDAYKVEDRTWGFVDVNKTHFVDGYILALPFAFPTDIDDTTKFFKLTEKININ